MRITTLLTTAVLAVAVAAPAFAQPPGGGRGMQRTPEMFKEADKNADSKLTKEEFLATLPEQAREQFGEQAFTGRDANTDGAISLEEFTAPGRGGGRGGRGGPPPAGQ